MTKFTFEGTGRTVSDGGVRKIGAAALVAAAGVVAWKALGSAAGLLGDILAIVPVAAGSLLTGAVVTYVAVKIRRDRHAPDAAPAPALWHARPDALPPREARAIAPAPVVNVNFGADLLAGFVAAAQQQAQPVRVIAEQSERQEIR